MNLSEEELPKALQKHAKEENINTNKKEKNKKSKKNMVKNINSINHIRNTRDINISIFIIWTIFRI